MTPRQGAGASFAAPVGRFFCLGGFRSENPPVEVPSENGGKGFQQMNGHFVFFQNEPIGNAEKEEFSIRSLGNFQVDYDFVKPIPSMYSMFTYMKTIKINQM